MSFWKDRTSVRMTRINKGTERGIYWSLERDILQGKRDKAIKEGYKSK